MEIDLNKVSEEEGDEVPAPEEGADEVPAPEEGDDEVPDLNNSPAEHEDHNDEQQQIHQGVLKRFEEEDGEFVVYPGQSNQSVSAMYNLYRAADQAAFPGDDDDDDSVLRRARSYSRAFLQERRASGQLNDKWVISKGLPGEVAYGLDFPWKASLPRVETRMYLEQYGGGADVWIGRVLYRMHLFNNDMYLDLAKADFTSFQRSCRDEWHRLQRWCHKNSLEIYGVTPKTALTEYFLAAANIFEPDRAAERLGWARTAVLAEAVSSHLLSKSRSDDTREWLLCKLAASGSPQRKAKDSTAENGLLNALNDLIIGHLTPVDGSDSLRETWKQWLMAWTPKKNHDDSYKGSTALLLVRTVEICSGRFGSTEQNPKPPEYSQLEQLTYSICSKLGPGILSQNGAENSEEQVDREMQELARHVYQSCDPTNRMTKQTFLHVARSYCYVRLKQLTATSPKSYSRMSSRKKAGSYMDVGALWKFEHSATWAVLTA